LLECARDLVEEAFPVLLVEGEISNLARPSSGHLYFTLKDDKAQIRCALFRNRRGTFAALPHNGQLVRARARLGIYPARGEIQLIVEHLEDAGEGALRRAFEALRTRLQAEGLFDPKRRRPLPSMPKRVALITSPSGAALKDMLQVSRRRFPGLPLLLYPVAVQGAGAVEQIVTALDRLDADGLCDVAILARGGGSLEDLQAFNDERVARAIANCDIPVVVGVGHETDVTIADFAADLRAPTPSAAAELVTPDGAALESRFRELSERLQRLMRDELAGRAQRVDSLERRLGAQHPARVLLAQRQVLQRLDGRMQASMRAGLVTRELQLQRLRSRIAGASPIARLRGLAQRSEVLGDRLRRAMGQHLQGMQNRLAGLARSMDAMSPLATLRRGYTVLTRERDSSLVREVRDIGLGERLRARLASGTLLCEVLEATADEPASVRDVHYE
jgi:exodeoxyribonuclease VII large subunit